nr:MAG TPA: aragonite protein [Caudoviricetes sp.]
MYRCIDTYCSVSVRLLSTSLSLSRYSFYLRSAYFKLGFCL